MHKGEARTRVKTKGLSRWMAEVAWQRRQQAEDLAGIRREGISQEESLTIRAAKASEPEWGSSPGSSDSNHRKDGFGVNQSISKQNNSSFSVLVSHCCNKSPPIYWL